MRDIRTGNMVASQGIESDDVLKRIGTLSFRNIGSLSKLFLFDSGKALIIGSGLRVAPSSGMTVSVPAGNILQKCTDDIIGALQTEDQTVTLDAASGVARIDIIEAQIKSIADKNDYSNIASESGGAIVFANTAIKRDIKYYLSVQKKTSSTTPTAGTAGSLTGTVSIATTIDLSVMYLLNIADGEDGSFQEIDCRGAIPNATTKAEIVAAINAAVGRTMASISGNYIVLTGNGVGEASVFYIKPPVTDTAKDALNTIFGVSTSGVYKYTYQGVNEWIKLAEIDIDTATTTITSGLIRNIDQKETWASESENVQVIKTVHNELIRKWEAGISYITGDKVLLNNELYSCVTNHTAGTFLNDLTSGYWDMINQEKLPIMDDNSYGLSKWKYIQTALYKGMLAGKLFSSEITSTYSLAYTTATGSLFAGGVLALNGEIHFIPFGAVRGAKFSSDCVFSTYALVYTVASAYYGGVLAPNGDIHFVPSSAARGQKISALGVVSTYALAYTTTSAYRGGILAPNGEIHFIPYLRATVGQKISIAGVVSTYALVYTGNDSYFGFLDVDGNINFIHRTLIQKVTTTGVVSTYALAYTAGAYNGGVLSPNGDIHLIPYTASVGQKISSAGVVSTYALAYTTTNAYSGGVISPNGDIHFVPYSASVGQKISAAGVVSTYALVHTGSNYVSGILHPDGRIVFIPFGSASRIQTINCLSYKKPNKYLCLSGFYNKL